MVRVQGVAKGDECLSPLQGHTNEINPVTFSPNGSHIASGSSDKTIRLWNANMGVQILAPFEGHSSDVDSVAFCTCIVSRSWDKTVWVWDATTGAEAMPPHWSHFLLMELALFLDWVMEQCRCGMLPQVEWFHLPNATPKWYYHSHILLMELTSSLSSNVFIMYFPPHTCVFYTLAFAWFCGLL